MGLNWDNGKENANYYLGFRAFVHKQMQYALDWDLCHDNFSG